MTDNILTLMSHARSEMTESCSLTNAIRASGLRLASFWVDVATHSTLPIPCEWHKSGSAPLDSRISTACRYHPETHEE